MSVETKLVLLQLRWAQSCSQGTEMEAALKVKDWSGLHTSRSLVQTPISNYCFYCTQKSRGPEFTFNRSCIHSHTRELTNQPQSFAFDKYFSWINLKNLKMSSLDVRGDRRDVSFRSKENEVVMPMSRTSMHEFITESHSVEKILIEYCSTHILWKAIKATPKSNLTKSDLCKCKTKSKHSGC